LKWGEIAYFYVGFDFGIEELGMQGLGIEGIIKESIIE